MIGCGCSLILADFFSSLSLSLLLVVAGAMAGFELGSGMFSNGNKPEQDAFDLREVDLGDLGL